MKGFVEMVRGIAVLVLCQSAAFLIGDTDKAKGRSKSVPALSHTTP